MTQCSQEEEAELARVFTEMLVESGFTDVRVERTPLPDRIMGALREKFADEGAADMPEEEMPLIYMRMTTAQGSFGMLLEVGFVALDLDGTGVTAAEIAPELPPPTFPDVCEVELASPEHLTRFREALERRPPGPASPLATDGDEDSDADLAESMRRQAKNDK